MLPSKELFTLAVECYRQNDFKAADNYLTQIVTCDTNAHCLNLRAIIYQQQSRFTEAEAMFRKAIMFSAKTYIDPMVNLATLYVASHQYTKAELLYRQLLEKDNLQHKALLYYNFANCQLAQEQYDLAEVNFKKALALEPNHFPILYNLSSLYKRTGAYHKAISLLHRALDLKPDSVKTKMILSHCYLCIGDFENGWRYYVSRPFYENKSPLRIKAEDGIGDELFVSSMLTQLSTQFSEIYYECDLRLINLLKATYPAVTFMKRGELTNASIYMNDLFLYYLPDLKFKTINRLKVDREKQLFFKNKVNHQFSNKKRIGISYSSTGLDAASRMPEIAFWRNLLDEFPHAHFINLQENTATPQQRQHYLYQESRVVHENSCDLYNDFDNLAALISTLDLVITIDNAVAHLAARLGIPVILLLYTGCPWRWLEFDNKITWAPQVIPIKQEHFGHWSDVYRRTICVIHKIIRSS